MSKKYVSVILPVFNTSQYLPECIDSLINQTLKDVEIIFVDDGSTDNSVEIIESYIKKNKNIKLIKQNHLGVGAARNNGLGVSESKYVHFLDSDDTFQLEMLEEMYNVAENNKLDMVVCSAQRIKNGIIIPDNDFWPINKYIVKYNEVFNSNDCTAFIFNLFAPEPWCSLYKKELLLKNNLRFSSLSSSNGADLNYIARICADRIMVLNKKFVNYRYNRPNAITSKKNYINFIKSRLLLRDYLIVNHIYEKYKTSFENNLKDTIRYIVNNMSNEDYVKFVKDFREEVKDDYKIYEPDLCKNKIVGDKFIKNLDGKRVVFWGASNFLRNYINNNKITNIEVLGIVDKDESIIGGTIGEYCIYSIKDLAFLKPDIIIVTIENNSKYIYPQIKEYISKYYPHIEVAPNIFI